MARHSLRGAALRYAARGFHVIPLGVKSKRPNFDLLPLLDPSKPKHRESNPPSYKQFAKTAATAEQIGAWWSKVPDANIGILCGYGPGVLVVDLDPNKTDAKGNYKLEPERRRVLLDREGFEVSPLVVKTTSGGWHMYYRHPRAPAPVVTQKAHSKGAGVDVQGGELAYVVAPPSIVEGKRYAWTADSDEDAELPAPPVWTIAPQDTSDTRVYTGHWRVLALETDLSEGGNDAGIGRNKTLRALALSKAKRGIPLDEALADLGNWNELRCKPPLTDVEVYRQVVHMYGKADKDMGVDGSDTIRLRYNGPPFPFDTLRECAPTLYRWVQTLAHERKVWPDMAAVTGLIGLSAAASYYRLSIEGVPKWRPPVHLWGVVAADSGSKKSVVYKAIAKALQPTKDALARVAEKFNAAIESEREIVEASKQAAKTTLRNKKTNDHAAAREQLRQANLDLNRIPAPLPPSWTASDITAEALEVKLAALGWVGLMSEEGADVLKGITGHYSGRSDMSTLLKGYDLGDSENDRVGRGHTSVTDARVSVLILTQPSVLAGLNGTEAEDRGLLARMQFCIPSDKQAVLPRPTVDPEQTYADFNRMMLGVYYGGNPDRAIHDSLAYEPSFDGTGADDIDRAESELDGIVFADHAQLERPNPRTEIEMHVSAEVWAILEQFQNEMTEVSKPGAAHFVANSWCKKAGEHALRMAAVMELAESEGKARELTAAKAIGAVSLVRSYFLPQYYVARDRMLRPRIADRAIHVLQLYSDDESFTTVDLSNELYCTTEDAVELVMWLADRGALSVKGRGRNKECHVLPGLDY